MFGGLRKKSYLCGVKGCGKRPRLSRFFNPSKLTKMEKKNFNACRVVLTSGNVFMYYFDGAQALGFASAGTVANGNCTVPCADGREIFQATVKEWSRRIVECEDVEFVEFV